MLLGMYQRSESFRTFTYLLVFSPFLFSLSYPNVGGIHMDVKCTQYGNGDGDIRIFVMGLKPNSDYTTKIIPDHNPPFSVVVGTDSEGILWVVPKIENGGISLDLKASVYEGKSDSHSLVISGEDDAPCRSLTINLHNVNGLESFWI
jgi:hypothetical protein